MSPQPAVLTKDEIIAALADLPDWRVRLGGLHTVYRAKSSVDAVELVHAIGQLANELDHHPDLDWRYDHVFLRNSTHAAGSQVTGNDIELARSISALAADAGAEAKPELYRNLEIAVDTDDMAKVRDVWAAVLGYKANRPDDLVDPWGRGPTVWFQPTLTPNPSRLHLDVWVEDDTADDVLAATESAGAQRLDDSCRPSFTVIGDTDGNRFCVCTNLGRG